MTQGDDDGLQVKLRGYKTKSSTNNGGWTSRKVMVRNGRYQEWRLDQHSFQLVSQEPTRLSYADFFLQDKVYQYHEEMKRVIQKYTGAAAVVIFHHKVRSGKAGRLQGERGPDVTQQYVHGIHTDASALTAERAYFGALKKLQEEWPGDPNLRRFRSGRFVYINAWRNIADLPILDNHLACCDENSLVAPEDYILSEDFDQGRIKQRYGLSPNRYHLHHWYYFPCMTKSEILLFKQWDSDATLPGRMCFHTAIQDPTAPRRSTPPRESVEVRAIAFFPNHQPNTCPELWTMNNLASRLVGAGASVLPGDTSSVTSVMVVRAMEHVEQWPLLAQRLVRRAPRTRQGATFVLEAMMQDPRNRLGLRTASQETKDAIKAEILAEDGFYNAFVQAKNKLEASSTAEAGSGYWSPATWRKSWG